MKTTPVKKKIGRKKRKKKDAGGGVSRHLKAPSRKKIRKKTNKGAVGGKKRTEKANPSLKKGRTRKTAGPQAKPAARSGSETEAEKRTEKKDSEMPLSAETDSNILELNSEYPVDTPKNFEKGEPAGKPEEVPAGSLSPAGPAFAPEEILEDSDLLDELAQNEENDDQGKNEEAGVERLVFSLAAEEYAIELTGIQEIIRYVEITPVPRSNESITGIISLRGTVIPIYDLRGRLDLDVGEVGRQTRIVVVRLEKGVVGLIVDKISGVVTIPDRIIEPPPSTSGGRSSEYLKGVATFGDRMLILLNLEKAILLN